MTRGHCRVNSRTSSVGPKPALGRPVVPKQGNCVPLGTFGLSRLEEGGCCWHVEGGDQPATGAATDLQQQVPGLTCY